LLLAACGGGGSGGGGGSTPPPATAAVKYALSGAVVTEVPEGIVLDDGNGNTTTLAVGDTSFKFRDGQTYLNAGTTYNVSVKAQPKGYACTVDNPTAKAEANAGNINVSTVAVRCKGPQTNQTYVTYTGERDGTFGFQSLAMDKNGDYFVTVAFDLLRVDATGTMHRLTLLDHTTGIPISGLLVRNVAIGSTGIIYLSVQRNTDESAVLRVRKTATENVYLVETMAESFIDASNQRKKFGLSVGMSIDAADNLYIADRTYNLIRKISSTGEVTVFAGSGTAGTADGTGTAAMFQFTGYISSLSHDASGNLYVQADYDRAAIRKISPAGVVTTISVPAGSDKPVSDEAGNLYLVKTTSNGIPSIIRINTNGVTDVLVSRGTVTFDYAPNGLKANAIGYVQAMRVSGGILYVAGSNPMAIYKIKL